MRSTVEELRANLLVARQLVQDSYKQRRTHWKYHEKANPTLNGPYMLCSLAWRRNNMEGYYYDIPNALRPFVPEGDLTWWWQHGQSRRSVLALFDAAIESLPKNLEDAA